VEYPRVRSLPEVRAEQRGLLTFRSPPLTKQNERVRWQTLTIATAAAAAATTAANSADGTIDCELLSTCRQQAV
jgi:hypothetical protein